jgi:hypothetical protein
MSATTTTAIAGTATIIGTAAAKKIRDARNGQRKCEKMR